MPISNSYPRGVPIEDQDLFVGTKANNNRTVNYTAQGVADYLNINSKVAIGGQMSFQFTIVPNIPKTIAFEGGLGNNTAFSAITKLIVSAIDLSTANITIFLNYLNNSQVLLSQQNQPNFFGHYKIIGYTQIGTSAFYELDLEFIGGNGTIGDKQYYDLVSFVLSTEIPPTEWGTIIGDIENQTDLVNYVANELTPYFLTPTGTTSEYVRGDGSLATFPDIPTVTPAALTKTDDTNVTLTLGGSPSTALLQATSLTLGWTGTLADSRIASASTWNAKQNALSGTGIVKSTAGTISYINGTTSQYIRGDGSLTTFPTIPTVGTWGALNYPTWTTGTPFVKMTAAGTFALDTNTYLTSAVTSVTATLPIISSGGNTPIISTSMKTGNLIGRYSPEQGVMEQIKIGTGLTLSGDTLINTGTYTSPLTTKGDLYTRDATADTRLPIGTNGQILSVKDGAGTTNLVWVNFPVRVSEVTAISPITSTEGTTPTISTSMSTNKLIGRSSAGTGVMEEITIGTGLTLSGGTLNGSATGVTSVGLTMPSAFNVASSPITSSGTLAVTGAGLVSQYVRGDGTLANFPASTGGGASLSFYLNGSVSQGTFGGVAFKEMDRTPILGAGTDFTINANGYIQSFITDANVPNQLEIPAGNWNFETYFSASSGGGSPTFYVELYKWNGTTLSLIASNSSNPESITNGTAIDLYVSALAIPQTTLLATDRLAVRIYVNHSGRTITLHTEDNHLCQVITTFSTGITALNGLTTQVQNLTVGTSGTDFAISSTSATHTFNLPTASATNRGALSSTDWSTFNGKQDAITLTTTGTSGPATLIGAILNIPQYSGGSIKSINSVSTNTSADATANTDYIYLASGTINITLPTAIGNQNLYTIKNVGTGVITIDTTSSQTIDGSLTAPIKVQYLSLTIISDGANWNII